ncbi:VOC family protein [Pseudalkalibacillus sp. SCS-8]|uniref:VOC family protein n=1 Tax=Pseudalkalibacillus nanhaiensis TaxID=3115291 RepID=UPI0032DA22EC
MNGMQIHHIGIETNCLEQSITFYERLGFKVTDEMELLGEMLVFLTIGDLCIELVAVDKDLTQSSNMHIALQVGNLEEFIQQNDDIVVEEGPFLLENGWRTAFVHAPSGEQIELIQMK